MTKPSKVGAPINTNPEPYLVEVGSFGDIDKGEGVRVIIEQGNVVFTARVEGTDVLIGFTIEQMLESIGEYNRKTGS